MTTVNKPSLDVCALAIVINEDSPPELLLQPASNEYQSFYPIQDLSFSSLLSAVG